AGYATSTGPYALTLTPVVDDFGNSFATAHSIGTLASTGPTPQAGAIDYAGDVDLFQFTAATTGDLTIQQQAPAGSSLDSVLTVYDGSRQQIAFNDDSNGTLNGQVVVSVTAGQIYYVQAAGYAASTGPYVVSITPVVDDFGNTFTTAQ